MKKGYSLVLNDVASIQLFKELDRTGNIEKIEGVIVANKGIRFHAFLSCS